MDASRVFTGVYGAAVPVIAVLFFYATTRLIQIEGEHAPFIGVTHIHRAHQIIKAAYRVVNTLSQFVIEEVYGAFVVVCTIRFLCIRCVQGRVFLNVRRGIWRGIRTWNHIGEDDRAISGIVVLTVLGPRICGIRCVGDFNRNEGRSSIRIRIAWRNGVSARLRTRQPQDPNQGNKMNGFHGTDLNDDPP